MRVDVPETPLFWAELETRLRRETRRGRRRRMPVATTALRSLRELNVGGLQVAFAVAAAAMFLLLSPTATLREEPLVAEPSETLPTFIRQYASRDDLTAFVERARAGGHEVLVVTDYVAGRRPEGTIIDIRVLGEPAEATPADGNPRSPVLVVMGVHLSDGSSVAD